MTAIGNNYFYISLFPKKKAIKTHHNCFPFKNFACYPICTLFSQLVLVLDHLFFVGWFCNYFFIHFIFINNNGFVSNAKTISHTCVIISDLLCFLTYRFGDRFGFIFIHQQFGIKILPMCV